MIRQILAQAGVPRRRLPKKPNLSAWLKEEAERYILMNEKWCEKPPEFREAELARCIKSREVVLVPRDELEKLYQWSQCPVSAESAVPQQPQSPDQQSESKTLQNALDSTWSCMTGETALKSPLITKHFVLSEKEEQTDSEKISSKRYTYTSVGSVNPQNKQKNLL
jgi:hypothetical protein